MMNRLSNKDFALTMGFIAILLFAVLVLRSLINF